MACSNEVTPGNSNRSLAEEILANNCQNIRSRDNAEGDVEYEKAGGDLKLMTK